MMHPWMMLDEEDLSALSEDDVEEEEDEDGVDDEEAWSQSEV
jgi:hypothetical protein